MSIFRKGFLWRFRNAFSTLKKNFTKPFISFSVDWDRHDQQKGKLEFGPGVLGAPFEPSQTLSCLLTCRGWGTRAGLWQDACFASQMIIAGCERRGVQRCIRFKKMKVVLLEAEDGLHQHTEIFCLWQTWRRYFTWNTNGVVIVLYLSAKIFTEEPEKYFGPWHLFDFSRSSDKGVAEEQLFIQTCSEAGYGPVMGFLSPVWCNTASVQQEFWPTRAY